MKLLVATERTQGQRDTDFTWTVPGGLVYLGLVCDGDQLDPAGPDACGYGRAFSGLNTHKSTTTAEIGDVDLTREDVVEGSGRVLSRPAGVRSTPRTSSTSCSILSRTGRSVQ